MFPAGPRDVPVSDRNPAVVGRFAVLIMAAVLCLAGCGATGWGSLSGTEDDPYLEALRRWSAEDEIYREFQSVFQAEGVFRSPAFRQAYVVKYSEDYQLSQAEANGMAAGEAERASRELGFLVAVAAPVKENSDLSSERSPWRVFLEGDDLAGPLDPSQIESLRRDDVKTREFYPFVTPWCRVYRISFKAPAHPPVAGRLALVITGVLGTARLEYHLEE